MTNNSSSPAADLRQETRKTLWVCTTVALILITILITLGNTLVVFTTWVDKRLHHPTKFFIACLAVSDLLVGVFSVPIRLYLHFHHTDLAKVELCRFWQWIDVACEAASILTLTIIGVDRYCKINMNFKYRSLMVTSRFIIFICVIWLISSIFATLGLFPYGRFQGVFAIAGHGCLNDNYIYITILAVVFFFLPLLVITSMYASIFYIAHQRKKRAKRGALGQTFTLGRKKTNFAKDFLQELKTVRVLIVVVLTFVICWGPFFTIFLLNIYKSNYVVKLLPSEHWNVLATIFFEILPSFNSLCNPIIYACLDREYNKAFRNLVHKLFTSAPDQGNPTSYRKRSSTQSFWLQERGTNLTRVVEMHGSSPVGAVFPGAYFNDTDVEHSRTCQENVL